MEDKQLIYKVVSDGDSQAFSEIVRRYSGMVFSKVLGVVHRQELAAELTQQTFVKAYCRMETCRSHALGPWLLTIAYHLAVNALDRERRQRASPIESVGDVPQDEYSEEYELRLQQMEEAISGLPPDDRDIIRMYYYKELSTRQIADRKNLSQQNVLVRPHRIRERLKKKLEL